MSQNKILLEQLAALSGCKYLSDLHYRLDERDLNYALRRCPAEDYPLSQWLEAVSYLTGEKAAFATGEQARAFLLKRGEKG